MLEVNVSQLRDTLLAEQQYWIHTVEAARQADTHALEPIEEATNSWADILTYGRFEYLPATHQYQPWQRHPQQRPQLIILLHRQRSQQQQPAKKLWIKLKRRTERKQRPVCHLASPQRGIAACNLTRGGKRVTSVKMLWMSTTKVCNCSHNTLPYRGKRSTASRQHSRQPQGTR